MIFNETKCHVNTSLGLVGGMHPPLCPRLLPDSIILCIASEKLLNGIW